MNNGPPVYESHKDLLDDAKCWRKEKREDILGYDEQLKAY
jgi:hypothetical protein